MNGLLRALLLQQGQLDRANAVQIIGLGRFESIFTGPHSPCA